MLVGRTLSGKSTTWKMLASASSVLAAAKVEGYEKVRVESLNPKSISMGELYGQYDLQTMEWTDGILSSVFRGFARDEKSDEKWLLLDGPVDALWIESMNTVMDDNKTLTLINGDRIGMKESMSLLFEVQDLSVASPATVSRAGMIYIDVVDLGWGPFVKSWVARNFKDGLAPEGELLASLVVKYVPRLLKFRAKEVRELVPTGEFNSVISLCNLVKALYALPENGLGKPGAMAGEAGYAAYVERWFAFACVWSIGAAVDEAGRRKMNEAVREIEPLFPPIATVYDYWVDPASKEMKSWGDKLSASWRPPRDMPFSRIVVPTVDTVRSSFLLRTLMLAGTAVLLVGNTGTGKTTLAQQELENLPLDVFGKLTMYFSAATSSNTTQDIIESVLEKRSKNKMGPVGGKKLVLLIDDLNMPKKDTYGSQAPLELVRQWIDYGGWYDRAKQSWRFVVDMQLVCAMGPPGGGKTVISERLQSRFHVINFTIPSDKSVKAIFETILSSRVVDFTDEVKKLVAPIVAATVALYESSVEIFLPTPTNCHYLFNLRDIAKVVQGLLAANARDISSRDEMLRLWAHECFRTFADRFTSHADIAKFRHVLDVAMGKNADAGLKAVFEGCESIEAGPVYGDFLGGELAQAAGGAAGPTVPYRELTNLDKLRSTVEEEMVEYNSTPGLLPMNLVFFRDALRHVCRIARILRTSRGNALLVGVGGSGRQSLARVAAFLTRDSESERMGTFSIEITKMYRLLEFHEDLKKLYNRTGVDGRPTMFLFSDTQIKEEGFLEDINNILNSGQVPNLHTKDERGAVIDAMRTVAKKSGLPSTLTGEELWTLFIDRVRSNLHVVLAMSPVGAGFRNRCRMYPSLVNCTTIDWFHEWPADALREVATKFLDDAKLLGGKPEEEAPLKVKVANVFAIAHQSVITASSRMLLQLKRYNYVTPTNYLELVLGYRELVAEKRRELVESRDKLANGLAKLEHSKVQVEEMQVDLAIKQKIVEKATTDCDALLINIVQEKRIADEQKAAVGETAARISVDEKKVKAIAADAEADLAYALPALEKAMAEVDKLDNASISEVKAYAKPPDAVLLVLSGVMTLFNVPVDWASAKKKIGESDFLRQLRSYDKDNVNPGLLKKLKKYTENVGFDPLVVRQSSGAAAALASWVMAIELYSNVAKEVEPKRNALKQAESLLAEKLEQLAKVQAELAAVIAKVDALNRKHTESVTEKTRLQMEAAALLDKLERAEKLIGGLSGERSRWEVSIARFEAQLQALPGDALVAAAFMSYAGPFDTGYRKAMVSGWMMRVREQGIGVSDDFNFAAFLSDPRDVRDWNIQGLPSDQFSTENGVIVTRGRRWPLMVDPQGQANKWIKEKEKTKGLKVTDLKAKDFLRELEAAITYGLPYLLQDVEEELDPSLEPVLSRAIVKKGARETLRLGDKELEYNRNFRLYITTKLPNPHYTPEVSTKAAVVNFIVKEAGLEAQLLGIVVRVEEPRLEQQKSELVLTVANGKRKLADLENTILRLLSEAKGSLLDDKDLVATLQDSKTTSEEVSRALKVAEETEIQIDAAREGYRPVATRASLLYFVLNDLASVDPMYQFSLDAYTLLFKQSIGDSKIAKAKSSKGEFVDPDAPSGADALLRARISDVNEWHTYEVYKYACRGLFERHKLLLSFQICIRRLLVEAPGKLSPLVLDFFLKGGVVMDRSEQRPNPCSEWLSPSTWDQISELDKLEVFAGLASTFDSAPKEWQAWYYGATPEREPVPADWEAKCDDLMKLAIVRTVRSDRVLPAAARFVAANLGPKYVEPPPFDLKAVADASTNQTPLVFVLSPGVDPAAQVLALAQSLGVRLDYCSLGQGQAPVATRMINDALKNGGWVFLQNCHLSISWMPGLEKIIDAYCSAAAQQAAAAAAAPRGAHVAPVPGAPHPSFRLWLSSSPHPKFPIAILQRGMKMTTEPPRSLRANLVRLYNLMDPVEFEARSTAAPGTFCKLVFALCWFHAILLERKKFKSLGFNIPYDFNDSDFSICHDILADYLASYRDKTPWDAIRYLIAEVNYGGRVTDDFDRRLTNVYVAQYFCEAAVKTPGYGLSSLPEYFIPEDGELSDYKEYIAGLPGQDPPEAFGQNANADIASAMQDSEELLGTLTSLQPRAVADGGAKPEDRAMAMAIELEKGVPETFDLEAVWAAVASRSDPEPLKVVLMQEADRYNKLLSTLKRTLSQLQKGIAGTIVITAELEAVFDALLLGRVPGAWTFAYPSLKPLGTWFRDLQARILQMRAWIDVELPRCFWLAGFTYPTGFLTAVLQTSARKNGLAIDTLDFEYPVLQVMAGSEVGEHPPEGAYIAGLFLEGARWAVEDSCLAEPEPMQLFSSMPVIWFKPVETKKGGSGAAKPGVYRSPMYLYPVRTGSRERPSYMGTVELKSGEEEGAYWSKRGTALLLALAS
jgi:dynein heavy chain